MAGRKAGDIWVAIHPDAAFFGTQARVALKKATAGIRAEIPVTADTRPAVTSIEALRARMSALNDNLAKLRLTADGKPAEAAIVAVQAKMAALAKTMTKLAMGADTKKLDAQIVAKLAELAKLRQSMTGLKMDADDKALTAKILGLERQAHNLKRSLDKGTIKGDINVAAAQAKLDALRAKITQLRVEAKDITLVASNVSALRDIGLVKAEIAALQKQARDIRLGGNIDAAGLLAAEAGLLGLEAAAGKLAPALETGDAALGVLGKALVGTGRGWGFLTRSIALFGGGLSRVLPVVASTVAIWHVLADAVIELGAVWIPATLAVGAFAIAASDAAVEIQRRMQAVHTVMDATGRSVPPMTRAMENLHAAVRPQVYQLFGEALTVMNSRTGTFAQVAKATGTVLDQLGARIVFAVTANNKLGTSTDHLSGFWKTAITDVSKLGDSIGNVFGIFGNFFKAIPGFAAGLLTIGDDFTKILESASAAAVPVLKWILLLHGYILYTGLAVTATLAFIGGLANLARQFFTFAAGSVLAGVGALKSFGSALVTLGLKIAAWGEGIIKAEGAAAKFGAALAPLAANPMLWVTAAALALGALVFAIVRSKDAAQQFNDTMQQTITNAGLSSVVSVIQSAQAATTAKLAAATGQLNQQVKTNTVVNAGRAGALNSNGAAIQNLASSTNDYRKGLGKLDAQQRLVSGRFAGLTKQYGGSTAALGLLNAAGITGAQITDTQGHAWAQALIQIGSTVQAYTVMGTQAGQLGNDLDVLGRTVTDQYTSVQKLNQAWGTFISDVTGTQGTFDTVAEGFRTLADHSGKLSFSLGKLKASYSDSSAALKSQSALASATAAVASAQDRLSRLQSSGRASAGQLAAAHARLTAAQDRLAASQLDLLNVQKQGKSAIDALTPAGLALNQAFTDQIGNLDKLFASWRTAGLSNNLFVSGVKDGIAPLLKYAAGSREATAQLVALAQEAGYQGPISFSALVKWLGSTHGATAKLKDITNQATSQEALLTGAMQAQGAFIANELIKDIDSAILSYSGVEKAVGAYGRALAQSGKGSDDANAKMAKAIAKLVQSGLTMGSSAQQLGAIVAKTFGISMPEAMKRVRAAMDNMVAGLPPAQKNFELFAIQGLGKTRDEADKLWKKFAASNLGALAGKADTTREKFDTLASKGLGISTAAADVLWQHLRMQYLDTLATKAGGSRSAFEKLAKNGLDLTRDAADKLWAKLRAQYLDTLANKSDMTKQHFEQLARQMGISKDAADKLWGSLRRVASGSPYKATVITEAHGTGQISITGTGWALGQGNVRFHAAQGAYIQAGSGPTADDVPAMLSRGEVVVPTRMVNAGAVDHLRGKIPGFAAGGLIGGGLTGMGSQAAAMPGEARTIAGGLSGKAVKAAMTQVIARIKAQVMAAAAAASGSGDIVSYARSFLGRIPYQMGGTSLKGMDCSAFTGMVYRHAGYRSIPRTSEAQSGWATQILKPQAGALAFYHSPAGGPDPGHVAIIDTGGTRIISQGGGMGPKLESIHALPLLSMGVPPGGFKVPAGGSGPSSASAAQAQAYARGRMGAYGWPQSMWPSLQQLWQGESGWNRVARNPSSGAYGIPQALPASKMGAAANPPTSSASAQVDWGMGYIRCMPVANTEILTRDGWKRYENVQVGDETVGYNLKTGRSEWTTITDINVYGNAPVVQLQNKTWNVTCTPNHRWVTSHIRQVDTRKMVNRTREPSPSASYRVDVFTDTDKITSRHSIRLAAPSDTGSGPAISLDEAELLGWVMGDGHIANPGTRVNTDSLLAEEIYRQARENPDASNRAISRAVGCNHKSVSAYLRARGEVRRGARTHTTGPPMRQMQLAQSKPRNVEMIDMLLAAEGILSRRYIRPVRGITRLPLVDWRFTPSYTEELLKRSGYDHLDPVPFVLSLSGDQRAAFLRGVFGAEGTQEPGGVINGCQARGHRTFSQADGTQQDAIILALYLSGHRPSVRDWSATSRAVLGSRAGASIGETKPFVSGMRTRQEDAGRAEVWCPTTTLGSWTARQGRNVFLTGNSVYGNPFNAFLRWESRSPHWYARGGLVPGMAAGGTAAGLRSRLAGEQKGERAKFYGLEHSFAAGPAKYRTKTTVSELGTLARHQAAEQLAYAQLSGPGLTGTRLHHFGVTARAVERTAGDQALNRLPGGHPGFAHDLRKYLHDLSVTASGSVPAGGGSPGNIRVPVPVLGSFFKDTAALRSALAGAEKGEKAKYFGLHHSYETGPGQYLTKTVRSELATLGKRQSAELSAYAALSGTGLTPGNLGKLGSAAKAETRTAQDKALMRGGPGGHPLWDADLRRNLARIISVTNAGNARIPVLGPVAHTYGGDVGVADTIGAFLHQVAMPFARGGMARSYDAGGYLPPGLSTAWNGTGMPEPVGAARGGGGTCVTVTLEVAPGGNTAFEQLLHTMIRKHVRVHGGSAQRAYGSPGTVSGSNTWRTG